MSTIIELATGSTLTSAFGSGVNKALNVEANSVFEIKESVAQMRKFAARSEKTSKAVLDLEKYGTVDTTNGGDIEDGVNPTWTVIEGASLITFDTPLAISVGFKLSPKLLRQARQDPASFMARYRKKIAFDMARREDVYIAGELIGSADNEVYAGAATGSGTVGVGSLMTIELFETMLDDMKEREYEPTDFIATSKAVGQLRRDARLLNDSDFSIAIKADGKTVTQIGDVMVQEVKGTTIIPNRTTGAGSGSGTSAIMIDREGAFGLVDFIKAPGASPVTITVGKPDPTADGLNNTRILGQSELQAKILDQNALIVAVVNKA